MKALVKNPTMKKNSLSWMQVASSEQKTGRIKVPTAKEITMIKKGHQVDWTESVYHNFSRETCRYLKS